MSPYTTMSSGTSFAGRAAGQTDAFFNALHRKCYAARGHTSSGVPIRVDGPHGRQCAGYVVVEDGRRILRKTNVRDSKHYCRKHDGFGVELDALRQAERLGAQAVRLVFEDADRVLDAPIATFANDGIRDTLGGFGTQIFLPLESWRDLSDPQGGLFGGVSP